MSSALSDSHSAWLAGPNVKGGANDRFIITGFASVTFIFIFKEKMRVESCGWLAVNPSKQPLITHCQNYLQIFIQKNII